MPWGGPRDHLEGVSRWGTRSPAKPRKGRQGKNLLESVPSPRPALRFSQVHIRHVCGDLEEVMPRFTKRGEQLPFPPAG